MVTIARFASSAIITDGSPVFISTIKSSLDSKKVSFKRLNVMQRVSPGLLSGGNTNVSDAAIELMKSIPSVMEQHKLIANIILVYH